MPMLARLSPCLAVYPEALNIPEFLIQTSNLSLITFKADSFCSLQALIKDCSSTVGISFSNNLDRDALPLHLPNINPNTDKSKPNIVEGMHLITRSRAFTVSVLVYQLQRCTTHEKGSLYPGIFVVQNPEEKLFLDEKFLP